MSGSTSIYWSVHIDMRSAKGREVVPLIRSSEGSRARPYLESQAASFLLAYLPCPRTATQHEIHTFNLR